MTPRNRRQRLNSLQQIAAQLRQTDDISAPDMTGSILDKVDAQRPFLDDKTRRMLWVGRAALGLSVAMVVLGVALTHRWAPEAVELVSRPAPLSNVVETVRTEAGERLVGLGVAMNTASASSANKGGLLTLITTAAPQVSAHVTPCTVCGPMLSPAEAARMVPCTAARVADDQSLAGVHSSISSMSLGATKFSSRFRLVAGLTGSGTVEDGHRVILDELSPLGAGAAGDAALAPK